MSQIERLLEIMARLRDPKEGCPWDRQQTFASIVPHTLEEAYEVAEAIERGTQEELRDELGDLLFQVVFYAQLAKEAGYFNFDDIVAGIQAKLIRRHPHVFGDQKGITTAEAQTIAWEAHKAGERRIKAKSGHHSVLDGVSLALPALTRAIKLQRRAAQVGFDWAHIEPVLEKVGEELREVRQALGNQGQAHRLVEEVGMDTGSFKISVKDQYGGDFEPLMTRVWNGPGPDMLVLEHIAHPFNPCMNYTVTVLVAKDNLGRAFIPGLATHPFTFSVTTEGCYPVLIWSQPAHNETDVPLDRDVVLKFSMPVNTSRALTAGANHGAGWVGAVQLLTEAKR